MASQSLEHLRNLGPASIRMLEAAGITTITDLRRLGSSAAFLAVREAGKKPTLNLLWALEGALRNVHWADLPENIREKLRRSIN